MIQTPSWRRSIYGPCLTVSLLAPPALAQEHCTSPGDIKSRAEPLADWDAAQTLSLLIETEAPAGFEAEEILAITGHPGMVILLFFHVDCLVHVAPISQSTFGELMAFLRGLEA
jgi:hypothetical protein